MKYYIMARGRVWLVNEGGTLRLPAPEQVPFDVKVLRRMPVPNEKVMWCESDLNDKAGWVHRDDMLTRGKNVEELAKVAAVKSYPRVAASVLLIKGKEVFMVKSCYGLSKGFLITPGGFVEYGENPREAVAREAKEETGLDARDLELLSVESDTFEDSGLHFVTVFYTGRATGKVRLQKEEISEGGWMKINKAIRMCNHPANLRALKTLRRMKKWAA